MGRQPRIVTLLPAATEIVAALGRREALVGRSHECDYPPGVERLPVITKPRSQVSAVLHDRGGAIHATLTGLLEQALSVYEVDVKALAQLAPDAYASSPARRPFSIIAWRKTARESASSASYIQS